jgi:hypothetical protein
MKKGNVKQFYVAYCSHNDIYLHISSDICRYIRI